jgi:hypothetical protein
MEKMYLVYDEYRYDGEDQGTMVTPCATMEIAVKIVKERYAWYLKESYLQMFVGENDNLREDLLNGFDSWEVDEDSVEIYICEKDTSLNLHIVEANVVCE